MYLPPLREELSIWPGPRAHDGQPSWTVQDPARNRFFRIDWLTFEVLQRWSLSDPQLIARSISDQTTLRAGEKDVVSVLEFLAANQLLKLAGADISSLLARSHQRLRPGVLQWLIHNYLFFRVPLVRPDPLLRWLNERAGVVFTTTFWQLTALAAVLGIGLAVRHSEEFVATFAQVANVGGAVAFFAVLIAVKVVHEIGHGLVAARCGCRVPTMGVAFLVLTPVAYTDVNEAWKLADRRSRVLIGAAGMLAELMLAAWATLAWALLPDGFMRTMAFVLATTTWIKSLLVNLSPIMRFDGYYLLSDALDLPNLHARVFALARWKLREWLFGFGAPPPEHFARPLARGLIALAFVIWIYRLVVFVGIALFVYHAFFKALGIVLFAVEIGWFIVLPVVSEMKEWAKAAPAIRRSRRGRLTGLLVGLAALLAFVPIPRRVAAVAELRPENEFRIVTADTADLQRLAVAEGIQVASGTALMTLESPALKHRLAIARLREATLKAQIQSAEADPAMRTRIPTMQAALGTAEAARRSAETALETLQPKAPFAGRLRLSDPELQAGETLERQESVAVLAGDGPVRAVAYIDERDLHLVAKGDAAWFIPDGCPGRHVELVIAEVERDATRTIAQPSLTTPFGGTLPAQIVDGALVPDRGVYRVVLRGEGRDAELSGLVRRGRVVVYGRRESAAARVLRAAGAVLWREAGF